MAVAILKFTPSAQDPEILEQLFVQREPLLKDLLDDVRSVANGGNRHHRLIVGPRGIGKSHLLALLYHRSKSNAAWAHVQIVFLPEDLWGINSFADLVAAILGNGANPGRSEHAQSLAEQQLRTYCGRAPTLILMENFDKVLTGIKKDGAHRFRSVLEDCPALLIATAPQLFDGVSMARETFYGFFDTVHLEELSVDDALELLNRVATIRDDKPLKDFLSTDVARQRVQTISALAGGHPRIWMLLSGCISVGALDELVPLFLETLDDLTPYYQSRVEILGPNSQAIVMALCRRTGALSNRDLADSSGVSQTLVATALRDLTDKGYVRKAVTSLASSGDQRLSWWELREPLLRLSLDVKHSRGRPLRLIVEFLREWFGLGLFVEEKRFHGALAQQYISAAISNPMYVDDERLSAALSMPSIKYSELQDAIWSASPESVYFPEPGTSTVPLLTFRGTIRLIQGLPEEALQAFNVALEREPANNQAQLLRGLTLGKLENHQNALDAFDRAITGYTNSPETIIRELTLALLLRCEALGQLGRDEEALKTAKQLTDLQPTYAAGWNSMANALVRLFRWAEAVEIVGKAIALEPQETAFRFTLAEASLSAGDKNWALRLREAFEVRSQQPSTPITEPDLLCRVLASRFFANGDSAPISEAATIFREHGELGALGVGMVESLRVVPNGTESLRWLAAWKQAVSSDEEMTVPLSIVEAGVKWIENRDQAHLLRLQTEARNVLEKVLTRWLEDHK